MYIEQIIYIEHGCSNYIIYTYIMCTPKYTFLYNLYYTCILHPWLLFAPWLCIALKNEEPNYFKRSWEYERNSEQWTLNCMQLYIHLF